MGVKRKEEYTIECDRCGRLEIFNLSPTLTNTGLAALGWRKARTGEVLCRDDATNWSTTFNLPLEKIDVSTP